MVVLCKPHTWGAPENELEIKKTSKTKNRNQDNFVK